MIEVTFLGTGSAMVTDRYNTCFLVKQGSHSLLVDCGGGHEILKQLEENKLSIKDIDAIFVSHSHVDHILGFPFLFREMITAQKKIKIICAYPVKEDIEGLLMMDIPEYLEKNKHLLDFQVIDEAQNYREFHFFKVDEQQYGFILEDDSKKIVFSGDAPLRDDVIENCDVLICAAFCSKLDNVSITGTHETIEEVLEIAEKKDIKKIVIIHTFTDLSRFSSEKIIIPREKDNIVI